jgi:hypothetical protein
MLIQLIYYVYFAKKVLRTRNLFFSNPRCLDIVPALTPMYSRLTMSARFQEAVLLRLPTRLREAIDRAADAEHSKRTDFIRRAIVERLRKDNRARASAGMRADQIEPMQVQAAS